MTTNNTITIDNQVVEINGEPNLLTLIRKIGIDLPTFCYNSELSIYGACRMCVVEVEGRGIVASCSTPPTPGQRILTNSPRVQRVRKTVLELLLANHDRECTTCEKSGHCKLQDLAQRYGVRKIRFGERDRKLPVDTSSASLVRDPNKCILCGDCVRMCSEVQGIGVLNFANRGSNVQVVPAFNKKMSEVECVNCGQCAAICPTGALVVKSETAKAWKAINDPEKMVVVQVAPAVRVALGEEFGLPAGEIVTGKMVAAIRRLGFDKVFDTCITADLTIMEEATELVDRIKNGGTLPLFTSCCPAWVKYAELYEPDMLNNLSTCRSPQQMFGSVVKRYWAKEMGKDPSQVYVVSIMPCTAKKFEAARPEFATANAPDVDLVLTTQELAQMLRESGLDFKQLEPDAFDMPFGFTTGAGVLFGASGGVTEAALRAAYEMVTGKNLDQVNFEAVRGFKGLKETTVNLNGQELKVAVVQGLNNAKQLLKKIKNGAASYHMIEVMACPGGCISGAGQPINTDITAKKARAKGIYRADTLSQLRKSQDNPIVTKFYENWLQKPNSHEAHHTLHTSYSNRARISGEAIQLLQSRAANKVDVAVCVGTCCYVNGSYDTLQEFMKQAEQAGIKDRINLHATFCMEGCESAPSIRINDEIIGGVTADKVAAVIKEKILKG
jgi:NADH-quinone oxidoreductase subunit G